MLVAAVKGPMTAFDQYFIRRVRYGAMPSEMQASKKSAEPNK